MQVRAKDGSVYYSARRNANPIGTMFAGWEVEYIGPSILDAVASFDDMAKGEGMWLYACGMVTQGDEVTIGNFFSRALGWTVEGGKVRTSIFRTLESDVKAAILECEEAVPM